MTFGEKLLCLYLCLSGGRLPWKECNVMDERVKFIAPVLEGEKVARLAVEFGISPKTAYKIIERYQDIRRRP